MSLARLKILILIFILLSIPHLYAASSLISKIEIPYPDSLVRGDVPVFSKAYGKDFTEFILDYGEGKDPKEWIIINKSSLPQKEYKSSVGLDMTSFGKTIDGNLGTWRTGLDEYEYGEHPINLSGTYTLRLRAFDSKGNVAEDKITLEVGRIILNSIGGKVQSKDGLTTLEVKEHSLYTSGILASLKALDKNPFPQQGLTLASKVYELREPDEKFAYPATLKIKYNPNLDPRTLRIYSYDTKKKTWQPLDTEHIESETAILAQITHTPAKFALYAIFSSNERIEAMPSKQQPFARKTKDEILFQHNTFEEESEWHTKYLDIGARSSLAKKEDASNCLRLTNPVSTSNFSSSIISEPFDAKEYPFIKFDYKIPKDLKINFQVKAGNKWHDIVFTDDEKIYWDVNMDKVGKIENIIVDDNWHTTYFNLYDMLKDKTNDFMVQEFTLADWDVTGFMKLELGHNKKDASFYIDNFIIAPAISDLTARAWRAFAKREFETSKRYAQAAIDIYENIKDNQDILNDIAACNFIIADTLRLEGKTDEAKAKYQYVLQNYPQAKCWDPKGWHWNVSDVAKDRIFTLETGYDFGDYSSEYLTNKAWEGLDKKDYRQGEIYAQKCIYLYQESAKAQQNSLKNSAKDSFIPYFWSLNNVGTCYFILGEAYLVQNKYEDAKKMYQEIIDNYAYSRCWDPRGWFWKVSDVAKERLKKTK